MYSNGESEATSLKVYENFHEKLTSFYNPRSEIMSKYHFAVGMRAAIRHGHFFSHE